jgi:hypothetical protein
VKALLGVLASALGGAVLAAVAPLGAVLAPLALLATDLATIRGDAGLPPPLLRAVVRLLQAAIVLFSLTVAVRLGGSSAGTATARWALPLLAILLAFSALAGAAWSVGAVAGLELRRPRMFLVEGALVALLDLGVSIWVTRLGLSIEHVPQGRRWPAAIAIAAALLARSVIAARLSRRARSTPGTPGLAVLAFLGWLAVAAVFATMRGSALAWSGLGAAVLLSVASALTQARARSPSAPLALARATIACMIAACLAVLAAVSGVA